MIDNWKNVAGGAWSMWAFYLLIVLEGIPLSLSKLAPEMQPDPTIIGVISIIAAAAGALLRLFSQRNLSPTKPEA